jgi:transposase
MDRYIGIDAHSESCTVAVMGPSGKRIRQQVVDTQAKVLIDLLKGLAGSKYVCIEEGQLAEWLVEALVPHVKEIVVVQPKEHRGRKSDADDAWALAEQIRVRARGTYVFKPTTQYRSLREAVRAYGVAVKDQTRAKNRFRGLLRSRSVAKLDDSIYDPSTRPEWIRKLPSAYQRRAEWLGQQVDATTKAYELAECWLKEEAKKCPEVKRLKTVPGLGDVRAAQVVALVVTPHRFPQDETVLGVTAGGWAS